LVVRRAELGRVSPWPDAESRDGGGFWASDPTVNGRATKCEGSPILSALVPIVRGSRVRSGSIARECIPGLTGGVPSGTEHGW
jgi:hypothetical protein